MTSLPIRSMWICTILAMGKRPFGTREKRRYIRERSRGREGRREGGVRMGGFGRGQKAVGDAGEEAVHSGEVWREGGRKGGRGG